MLEEVVHHFFVKPHVGILLLRFPSKIRTEFTLEPARRTVPHENVWFRQTTNKIFPFLGFLRCYKTPFGLFE